MSSSTDLGIIPDSFELPIGRSAVVDGLEHGLAFDEKNGMFRLLNEDTAKLAVLKAKPTNWKRWAVRILAPIGGIALLGCIAFTASHFWRAATTAPVSVEARPAAAPPAPAAAVEPEDRKPEPPAAVTAAARPAVKAPAVAPKVEQPVAPKQSAATVPRPQPAPAQQAVTAAPAPRPQVAAAAKPVPAPEPPTPTPAVVAAAKPSTQDQAPKAPVQSAPPVQAKAWAIRVEQNGVTFSGSNKLFRVGEMLPNGELLVDVDAATATYVTDKGMRQIRSTTVTR